VDVLIADVPPVLAQMRRNAVGARSIASFAARMGSGRVVPLAFLSVATWSIFSPSRTGRSFLIMEPQRWAASARVAAAAKARTRFGALASWRTK